MKYFLTRVRLWLISLLGVQSLEGHFFLSGKLLPGSRVIDAGANHGRFAVTFADQYQCEVIAIEPDPQNFALIPVHPKIHRVQAALGFQAGIGVLLKSEDSTAHRLCKKLDSVNDDHREVATVTLSSLMAEYHWDSVDLLKLDIEGMEWDVLNSLSDAELRRFAQVTVEFHDFCGLMPRSGATWEVYCRFARLGFFEVEDPYSNSYNVLFVNTAGPLDYRERWLMTFIFATVWWSRKWDRVCAFVRNCFRLI